MTVAHNTLGDVIDAVEPAMRLRYGACLGVVAARYLVELWCSDAPGEGEA